MTTELLGLAIAGSAHRLGHDGDLACAIRPRHLLNTANRSAWFFWLFLADDPFDLLGRATLDAVRAMAGQQFVEQDTQGVDITGGSDRLPSHPLLARGITAH